ncbi:hypothetical protein MSV52_001705 [Escherichia coli]|nr:hypothetical protein [Escherichia coli]
MKLKHVGMIVVSVLAMSSAAVSAAEGDESVTTTVNGGVIHFKGEVVNAACAIDSESMNQTIQILDRTGEVLILDGATFSAKTDLIDGTNILPFQARYIALGQSVAGTANADATFKVQYL